MWFVLVWWSGHQCLTVPSKVCVHLSPLLFSPLPFAWRSGTMPAATVDHSQRICEVWANNLEEELKRIRHVIRKYNYIAMVSGPDRDTRQRLSHLFF